MPKPKSPALPPRSAPPSASTSLSVFSPQHLAMADQPGQEEGDQLCQLYQTAEFAQMHLLVLGLYAYGVKARLAYGAFGTWLHVHAPELARPAAKGGYKPSSALHSYMQLAASVLEAMGIDLLEWFPGLDSAKRKLGLTRAALPWEPHQLLLFTDAELDPSQRVLRERIHNVLAGNTKKSMVARFVTTKEDEDSGALTPTTGAGQYHATKKDGSPRQKKRTFAEKDAYEALAAAQGLLVTLRTWISPESALRLNLLPPGLRTELRLLAYDLQKNLTD